MHYEEIDIPSEEQGKYSMIITGGGHKGIVTRVYYNDDGSINEKETYNPNYLKKLEESRRPKEKPVNEVRPKVKPSKKVEESAESSRSDSDSDWFTKILWFPFKLVWWIVKAIWWIVKQLLKIVLSCMFLGWLADAMGLGSDDN